MSLLTPYTCNALLPRPQRSHLQASTSEGWGGPLKVGKRAAGLGIADPHTSGNVRLPPLAAPNAFTLVVFLPFHGPLAFARFWYPRRAVGTHEGQDCESAYTPKSTLYRALLGSIGLHRAP